MRYQKTVDVWSLSDEAREKLAIGQWVRAGIDGPIGRYLGTKAGGSIVVAWQMNAKGAARGVRNGYRKYQRTLRDYARAAA